jgi:hypothetical protein
MLSKIEKIERGMMVKTIPEHNQTQKFSEFMGLIVEHKKEKAYSYFTYKKTSFFQTYKNKRLTKRSDTKKLTKANEKFAERNNVIITKEDVNKYTKTLVKQYQPESVPQYIPYTEEDVIKKFGRKIIDKPDDSILQEIKSMKKRGL